MNSHSSKWIFRPLAVVLGLAAASGIAIMFLRMPSLGGPETMHRLSTNASGSDPIGIWQEDPVYGWSHRPGSIGHHRFVPDFDVDYSIDGEGHRRTGQPSDKPKIVALGGSFTFGYGVEDTQTYPAFLEKALSDYDVINAGVMAWGTTHAWLKLQDILATEADIRLVLYGFIDHHLKRNWLRKSWLTRLGAKHGHHSPYVEVDNGRPVFKGLADPQHDGMPNSPETDKMEIDVTRHLLIDLSRLCRDNDIPFVFVHLPDRSSPQQPDPLLPALEVIRDRGAVVDLRTRLDPITIEFAGNNHPNPNGHQLIAAELLPVIQNQLHAAHKRN